MEPDEWQTDEEDQESEDCKVIDVEEEKADNKEKDQGASVD